MQRSKKPGFVMPQFVAMMMIVAVIAAATAAPMRAWTGADLANRAPQAGPSQLAQQELASLNAMAQTYFMEQGVYPRSADELVSAGYVAAENQSARDCVNQICQRYHYAASTGTFTARLTSGPSHR